MLNLTRLGDEHTLLTLVGCLFQRGKHVQDMRLPVENTIEIARGLTAGCETPHEEDHTNTIASYQYLGQLVVC
jgi:hypothetical protein